jgi:hypothetical protein
MRQIKISGVYFFNVAAIFRVGDEGHTLSIILPALVQSTSVSLVRYSDHLNSAGWTSGQTGKFFRTAIINDMKHKNNATKRLTAERGYFSHSET